MQELREGWGEFVSRTWVWVVVAANTAGMVVGGLLALRWQPQRALAVGVALMAVEAVPLLLLGLAPVVVGVAVEQFAIAWDVSLQQNVPTDRLSRVYSYDALGSFVAIPLGQVAVGPLAGAFGLRRTLVGCAVLVLVPTGLALLSPSLRSVRRTDTTLS